MVEINELFQQINRLLALTIKFKDSYSQLHIQEIKYQAQSLGIKLGNQDLQLSFLKSNSFVALIRAKTSSIVNKFLLPNTNATALQILKHANLGSNTAYGQKPTFKFWVECSGNNHPLVKQILKKRGWLVLSQDYAPPVGQYPTIQESTQKMTSSQVNNLKINNIYQVVQYKLCNDDEEVVTANKQPHLIWTQLRRIRIMRELTCDQLYNHLDGINSIATKSGLFLTLRTYYKQKQMPLFDCVPETYIIPVECRSSSEYARKEQAMEEFAKHCGDHIWILKPGENTNRGHGIQIFQDLRKIVQSVNNEYAGSYKTVILQKYIPNPYLIHKRKFDFRVYSLLTHQYIPTGNGSIQRVLRGYFYEEGYLRTSCKEFSLKRIDNKYVHLTNDAVQKYSQDYGKFENGNKMSYEDFKTLLLKERQVDFSEVILPQIKQRIKEVFEAAGPNLVGEIRTDYNGFELMGFDFMLDADLKLYLIECNTNPCLETDKSILLQRIIPQVLDQTVKIAIDPFLRANEHQFMNAPEISLSEIKYELVYEHKYEQESTAISIVVDGAEASIPVLAVANPLDEEEDDEQLDDMDEEGEQCCIQDEEDDDLQEEPMQD